MIYLEQLDDSIVYEVVDNGTTYEIRYADMGNWTDKVRGKVATRIRNINDFEFEIITDDFKSIKVDITQLTTLYFLLDYIHKHTNEMTLVGEKFNFMKFEKVVE